MVRTESQDPQVFRGLPDPPVLQGWTVKMESQDLPVFRDLRVFRDLLELQDKTVKTVRTESQDRLVFMERLVPQERLDRLVKTESQDRLERRGLKDQLEMTDPG
jgi:hypothetical protein